MLSPVFKYKPSALAQVATQVLSETLMKFVPPFALVLQLHELAMRLVPRDEQELHLSLHCTQVCVFKSPKYPVGQERHSLMWRNRFPVHAVHVEAEVAEQSLQWSAHAICLLRKRIKLTSKNDLEVTVEGLISTSIKCFNVTHNVLCIGFDICVCGKSCIE